MSQKTRARKRNLKTLLNETSSDSEPSSECNQNYDDDDSDNPAKETLSPKRGKKATAKSKRKRKSHDHDADESVRVKIQILETDIPFYKTVTRNVSMSKILTAYYSQYPERRPTRHVVYGDWVANGRTISKGFRKYKIHELMDDDEDSLEIYRKPRRIPVRGMATRGPRVNGPDVNAELYEDEFDSDADVDRQFGRGLNIEFMHNGQKIIGHFQQELGEKLKIDIARDYKHAYCPSRGVHCPSSASITDYYFTRCKVKFKGETCDGDEVNETQIFPSKACHYGGNGTVGYAWLEMTISLRV